MYAGNLDIYTTNVVMRSIPEYVGFYNYVCLKFKLASIHPSPYSMTNLVVNATGSGLIYKYQKVFQLVNLLIK